jgi:hypothetical protein
MGRDSGEAVASTEATSDDPQGGLPRPET